MKFNLKNFLLTCFLMVIILGIINFNLNFFIDAPENLQEKFIDKIKQSLNQQFDDEVVFYNEFILEQPMYVFASSNWIYIVSQDHKLLYKQTLTKNLDPKIQYGLYQDKFIKVEKQGSIERFYDYHTQEIVFTLDRRL